MKLHRYLYFIILTMAFLGCQEAAPKKTIEKQEKIQPKEIEIKPEVKADWDSLNRHNVTAFFTEYGKQNKETKVLISTKFGDIKLLLYNDTPIHRANFIFLTKIKYFNTTVFYRVAKDFVIQGGNSDEMYTMTQRQKYGNYLMDPEFRPNRKHKYGALAAAREWDDNPNKLSSPFEFYIVQSKKGAYHLDNEHTVFGEVISGFSTLEKISKVEVGPAEWPREDIDMKVRILD